ncbi:MAG: peptidoglycan-binding protein [Alphaproteobacteria bacterium]|nr:peptidoglycan-binding protein [Alphaproteobacteria bacterium]
MRDNAPTAAAAAPETAEEIDPGAGAPGPWSVKGIDEATREIARAAARAAGMPVGQWIDQTIRRAASMRETATVTNTATHGSAAAGHAIVDVPPAPPSALVSRGARRRARAWLRIAAGLVVGLALGFGFVWQYGRPGASAPVPDPTLARIQTLLTALRLDPGPADGRLRADTRRAIETFQRYAGLDVDGRPTAALLAELEAVAGAASTSR